MTIADFPDISHRHNTAAEAVAYGLRLSYVIEELTGGSQK
jgi:hypothetical protein